jgi:hypothetical protein
MTYATKADGMIDVGQVHANHDEVAVCEVHQPQDSERKAQTSTKQPIDGACQDTQNQCLDECGHPSPPLCGRGTAATIGRYFPSDVHGGTQLTE